MKFGKTINQKAQERHLKHQKRIAHRSQWICSYAWWPTQIIDGTWVWFERVEYTDYDRSCVPGGSPRYKLKRFKRHSDEISYRIDETHRPTILERLKRRKNESISEAIRTSSKTSS
jgi:hypothetical protein